MNAGVGEMMKPREFVEITDWVEVLRWKRSQDEKAKELHPAPMNLNGEPLISHELVKAKLANVEVVRIPASQMQWSYRHCEGWRPGIIARVGLSTAFEPKEDILARVKAANQTRLSKQPLDMPSCGSVFVNPPGHKSGQLIEQCGLKGFAIGGAKVSEKHANFIVNFAKAKATDIHNVIEGVRKKVESEKGVKLSTEVVYMGEWDEQELLVK
jgi:UDP-N-acetylmuramate dehydrogenase